MPQYSVLTHNGKEYKVFNFRSFVGGCAGRVGRPGCPVAPLGMAFRPSRHSVSGWVAVIAFQERTAANQCAMHWVKIMDCMIACRRIDDHFEVSVPCLPPIAIFPYPFDMKRLRSPHAWLGLLSQSDRRRSATKWAEMQRREMMRTALHFAPQKYFWQHG
jgi:hypothetical protein